MSTPDRGRHAVIVGYLGPRGTYTEDAAQAAAPDAALKPLSSIEDVFEAVATGIVTRGVVPIENVIQGPVTEALDNLYAYSDRVTLAGMIVLPIEHAIGGLDPKVTIADVYSKDQALKQCSHYLSEHHPSAERHEAPSTTAAMEKIANERLSNAAAIGSARALESYGLVVFDRNIGNAKHNKTKFAILAQVSAGTHAPTGADATLCVVYPHRDRIGLLSTLVDVISGMYRLNLSAIHSRPDARGAFRFYLEIEGHMSDPTLARCIDTLRARLEGEQVEVTFFGSYPRCSFIEQRIKTVGIIGGTGKMGQWLRAFFERIGYEVLVSDPESALGFEECVKRSDAVIVSVPIRHTLAVIDRIGPYFRPGQLIVDNTSIKSQPVARMLQAVAPGVEVLGMHTVFGPTVGDVVGQNVIFTKTSASGDLASEFESIFYKQGARITNTTPEHHDRQMAFHQNLEHLSKVALADALVGLFPDTSDIERYSSPNSRASLATMGRLLAGDPELYGDIQAFNQQAPSVIEAYSRALAKLAASLAKGDSTAFKETMSRTRDALGSGFVRTLMDASSALQRDLDEELERKRRG